MSETQRPQGSFLRDPDDRWHRVTVQRGVGTCSECEQETVGYVLDQQWFEPGKRWDDWEFCLDCWNEFGQ